MILIMIELNLPQIDNILVKLKEKTAFASMYLIMKTSGPFQSTFQIKNVKTPWIYFL